MTVFEFFGHLSYITIAVSFLLRDILLLRFFSIAASCMAMVFAAFSQAEPMWLMIGWQVVFISINSSRIIMTFVEKANISFSQEESILYDSLFSAFSPLEFIKLMRVAEWRNYGPGMVLSQQGEDLEYLSLIYNGAANVFVDGAQVATLKDGNFIGEISFTTNKNATATVEITTQSRVLVWPKSEIRQMLKRNPAMISLTRQLFAVDMANKLQNSKIPAAA